MMPAEPARHPPHAARSSAVTQARSGIDAVGNLAEPLRRKIYDFVAAQGRSVTRAEVAEAVGVHRNLATFHLDKLVEAGLLDMTRRKLTGRGGPGSGRPAKLYWRAEQQHSVHLPPRDYETAAHLLAEAVERCGADSALFEAAREEGRRRGSRLASGVGARLSRSELDEFLTDCGYEPAADEGSTEVRLRNCPFHSLAVEYPPLACGMNLELVSGALVGAGIEDYAARMEPHGKQCCVLISKTNID